LEVEFESATDINRLRQIPGVKRVQEAGKNKYMLYSDSNNDLRSTLFEFAVANNLKILTLQRSESSLEEIFHQLTGKKGVK
jgi:ABC-2 type transport system ATP-binding protein